MCASSQNKMESTSFYVRNFFSLYFENQIAVINQQLNEISGDAANLLI